MTAWGFNSRLAFLRFKTKIWQLIKQTLTKKSPQITCRLSPKPTRSDGFRSTWSCSMTKNIILLFVSHHLKPFSSCVARSLSRHWIKDSNHFLFCFYSYSRGNLTHMAESPICLHQRGVCDPAEDNELSTSCWCGILFWNVAILRLLCKFVSLLNSKCRYRLWSEMLDLMCPLCCTENTKTNSLSMAVLIFLF